MKLNFKLCSLTTQNKLCFKLASSILLLGLAFRFFFFQSNVFSPIIQTSISVISGVVQEPPSVVIPDNEDQIPQDVVLEKCDLFTGKWIPNPSGPLYTNETCNWIESPQNCISNGRPDTGYLYWKWSPRDCVLPKFNAQKFLRMMRNKHWALIGDSISRNHVQSLLCMLSTVEQPVQIYHDEEYKSRKWHFPLHNLTVSVIWSPYLMQAAIFEDNNGVSTSEVELHLDRIDSVWSEQLRSLDYVIMSTGKWFLKSAIYHEDGKPVGCHHCPGKNLPEVGFVYAYNKTLKNVLDFIAKSGHPGTFFFRTSTPDHFENGEWHNGGNCPRIGPAEEGEVEVKEIHKLLRDIELTEFEQASKVADENGVNLQLLDFMSCLLLRPDGHPGPYRRFHPFAEANNAKGPNDCLHWCLPGPIDYLNDIIMETVVRG